MSIDMAKVMDINPLNFVSEVPGSAEDIMQTLFWLNEDNGGTANLFYLIRSDKKKKPPQRRYPNMMTMTITSQQTASWYMVYLWSCR